MAEKIEQFKKDIIDLQDKIILIEKELKEFRETSLKNIEKCRKDIKKKNLLIQILNESDDLDFIQESQELLKNVKNDENKLKDNLL
jgi:hypothetical protein